MTGYDCSASSGACTTSLLPVTSCSTTAGVTTCVDLSATIQSALCNLRGSSASALYMLDTSGTCVTVTARREVVVQDATLGVYKVAYTVVFAGNTLRGNLPKMVISATT